MRASAATRRTPETLAAHATPARVPAKSKEAAARPLEAGARSPAAARPSAPTHANARGRSGVIAKRPSENLRRGCDREPRDERGAPGGAGEARRERDEPREDRGEDRGDVMRGVRRHPRPAADQASDDADEPGMVEISRLGVERVAGVEGLAVAEADVGRGVEANREEHGARERKHEGRLASSAGPGRRQESHGCSIRATSLDGCRRGPSASSTSSQARTNDVLASSARASAWAIFLGCTSRWTSSANAARPRSTLGRAICDVRRKVRAASSVRRSTL